MDDEKIAAALNGEVDLGALLGSDDDGSDDGSDETSAPGGDDACTRDSGHQRGALRDFRSAPSPEPLAKDTTVPTWARLFLPSTWGRNRV